MTRSINAAEFDSIIASEVPVLVDFWAEWCGPCRALSPILEEMDQRTGEQALVVKVNVDENPDLAGRYGIRSIPTVMVFKQGEVQQTLVGVQPQQQYLAALQT